MIKATENLVVSSYGGKKLPSAVNNLAALRWYLFSKHQYEMEKLPPTASALKFKIFRSHFIALVLKRACLNFQQLPSFENYGWEIVNVNIMPIMTDELPAPLALVELSFCSCKTNCDSNQCKCYKNELICSDMCKCVECYNNHDEK